MKAKFLFRGLARAFLMVVMLGNFLAIPNQTVLAKPLSGIFTTCVAQSQIPAAECNALTIFYASTNGVNWSNRIEWLQTDTPCSWYGVTCGSGTNVTELSVYWNQLSGFIPTQLGSLTQLTRLDLSGNQLTGSIPAQLGNLAHLSSLILSDNQLSGSIPIELGSLTQLQYLYLYNNHLSSSIPTQLNSLTKLKVLHLGNNQLSGSIPTQLDNLANLEYLDLSINQLTGSIPTELGNLTNLKGLGLTDNQLTGSIPTELGNLTNLTSLCLNGTQLTGSIPTQLGNLTQLTYLYLSNNQLSGSIPAQLGNLTQLTYLFLDHNQLSGPVPAQLGNLTGLTLLGLNNNQLSGSIPIQLGNLTYLNELHLDHNQFTGSIPTQLGNLTMGLWELHLNNNQLSGSVPTELGNLIYLNTLYLDNNQLTGEIPASFANFIGLTHLTLSCGLTSSNPAMIGFIDVLIPGWQNNICPTVLSITRGSPNPTSSSGVNFTITFSEAVTGVDTTDFRLTASGVSGASVTSVSGLGVTRTVRVNTGTGNGAIRLDLIDNDSIIDTLSHPLGGAGAGNGNFTAGQVYTVSKILTFSSSDVQDGWILESSETGSVGGTINNSAATFNLGDNAARKQYRGILSFSSGASLPDTAVITKVTLKVMKQNIIGGGNPVTTFGGFMVDIKKGFFGSTSALQAADFQAVAGKSYGPFNTALVGGWYSIDLAGAGAFVNKLTTASGLTQIRLRFKLDDNNNAVANILSLYSGNAAAASRPQLVITYYVP